MANGANTLVHIRLFTRVRLVEHTLVPGAGGAGLAGINAGNDQNFVRHLLLHLCQAVDIVNHRILPIRRARADHQQQLVALAADNGGDLLIPLVLVGSQLRRQGHLFFQLLRNGQLANKVHMIHFIKILHGLYLISIL